MKTNCQGKDIKTTHALNGYYHCATLTMMRDHVIYRPNLGTSRACLAQLVEHLICNQRVGGSNPSTGMGLWKETALMRNLSPQVYLATTHYLRCWEQLSLRCSLDADASGVSGERPRGSRQLHHYGDVRQFGAPPACGAGASRFDPGTSHD